VEFAYQVTGVRDGFENQKVIVDVDSNDDETQDVESEKRKELRRRAASKNRGENYFTFDGLIV